MNSIVEERVAEWLTAAYDPETRAEIKDLREKKEIQELNDRFYCDLDFGTGGLRGLIGAGTNRMNKYVVRKATQGLANYINQQRSGVSQSAVIAFDSRIKSDEFAREAAAVLCANGIKVYLFKELRPTPELSFAVRELKATAGIVITASHNPKEYNGYKVYWDDGAQVVPPHDRNIINEVRAIQAVNQVKWMDLGEAQERNLLIYLGSEVDEKYFQAICQLAIHPDLIQRQGQALTIVYSPLHGTGGRLLPKLLERLGFQRVFVVPEQLNPDGRFPTVKSPNPEEAEALNLSIKIAKEKKADLVLATDPDSDRLGIAVQDEQGQFVLLNGNQIASLMASYIIEQQKIIGRLPSNPVLVKSIVTTELLKAIGAYNGIETVEVLTGFKYIGQKIREYETLQPKSGIRKNFIFGGEESYGYLTGTYCRDKDALGSACMISEMALFLKLKGWSLYRFLIEIYKKYGYYREHLKSITIQGQEGLNKIEGIMKELRQNPLRELAGEGVREIMDLEQGQVLDGSSGQILRRVDLPRSNVLIYLLKDGSKITLRPSGTEPKIKFYFSAVENGILPMTEATLLRAQKATQQKVDSLIQSLMQVIGEG